MRAQFLILIACLVSTASCSPGNSPREKIIGKWSLAKVMEYGSDVTEKHNPNHNRWIEFKQGGTFVSDGDPFGRNTGRWAIDSTNSILFIDSDVEDDDSEWRISFEGDEFVWVGIGHPRKENTTLIHEKID